MVWNWALGRDDALILVTTDHETGGLTILQNNDQGNFPSVSWSTTSHTATHVPVYAWGPNAGMVGGTLDNTGIYDISVANAGSPTAVGLAAFRAEVQGDGVLLTWQTATEIDLLGFHLYRTGAGTGPKVRLNGNLIPARAPGSPVGATYQYLDPSVQPGGAYHYWLETVDVTGAAARHGPARAILPLSRRVLLPLLTR